MQQVQLGDARRSDDTGRAPTGAATALTPMPVLRPHRRAALLLPPAARCAPRPAPAQFPHQDRRVSRAPWPRCRRGRAP